jgi:glycosyltransferase involved in cell wall biosynthesis
MRAVLALITKDSIERLGELFTMVLMSSLQVPYDTIILVDDGSDSTKDVVKSFARSHGKEVIIERSRLPPGWSKPTRATARQTAIDIFMENTFDEWLFFLDDDCMLKHGWWWWAVRHGVLDDPKVGEVWGISWDVSPAREQFLKAMGIDLKASMIKKFEERGGTHDTLYRRAALDGVKIPPELHAYEDAWLHFWVKCHGWKYVVNPVGVTHFHSAGISLKAEKEKLKIAIESALKYGISEYKDDMLEAAAGGALGLLRPIAGFVPMLFATVRAYGVRRGAAEAVKNQYLKLWFRWQVLRLARGRRLPDPCEVMRP